MKQCNEALLKANEVRFARAELKREVRAGNVSLGEYLAEVNLPPWLQAMPIEELLLSTPRMGATRVNKLLREVPIKGGATVGDLTYRKRRVIAERLARIEAGAAERAEKRAGRAVPRIRGSQRAFKGEVLG